MKTTTNWTPKDIPGLTAWYSADDAGTRYDRHGRLWLINRAHWSWWRTALLWMGFRVRGAMQLRDGMNYVTVPKGTIHSTSGINQGHLPDIPDGS